MTRRRSLKNMRSNSTSWIIASIMGATALTVPALAQDNSVEFAADVIDHNPESDEVVATGRVTLTNDGYILEAAKVIYNQKTGEAVATGAVKLTLPDGDIIWSDHVELNRQLKNALVNNIRLLMSDGAQVAARSAVRDGESGTITLDRAVYSPCRVIEGDPTSTPVWKIKAVKVVHDKGKKRIYYDNATIEIFGVPVLWFPKFSHPDPTVDRASGFLPVELKTLKELGVVIGMPYYHSFNKSQDVTLTPILTTNEGLVLAAEYRQMMNSGSYIMQGSGTYTDQRNDLAQTTGRNEFRGHFFSNGQFNHTDNWRSSYQVNWASDDTYLRRYDFSQEDTLITEYNLEAFYGPSYFSARALGFQGLRQEDISGLTAFALPIINAEYISKYKPLGGTFKVTGNALALRRTDGLDTERLSASASWNRQWITGPGLVVDANALVRSDAYTIHDADRPDDPAFSGAGSDEFRNLARISTRLSWPLIKITNSSSHIIEPIVQVDISPNTGHVDDLVNEDSRAFELNHMNIFSSERAAGYDLWEEGNRLTYGLKWQYDNKNWATNVMVGQSLLSQSKQGNFEQGSGLNGRYSSIVGAIDIQYKEWFELNHHFRLNEDTLSFQRNEIDLNINTKKISLKLGYLYLNRDLNFINREDREEIRAEGRYRFSKKWSLMGNVIENLSNGYTGVEFGTGIEYEDECLRFSLQFRQTNTFDRDIKPGSSIMFRIKLKNLG